MVTIGSERLRRLPALAALDEALLQRLAGVLHHQHCPAGATVFAQHDEVRDVFIVLHGHLRITAYSQAGREIVFHDLQPGDMVGELSAIDGAPRGATLVAVSQAELGCIESGSFNRLLQQEPAFALFVIRRLTRLVRSLNRRIYLLAAPVPNRVSSELLRLAERHRRPDNTARLAPAPKHVDIANRVNTHREAVSRALADLERQAIIRRSRTELFVHDLAALRAHAEGAPRPTTRHPATEVTSTSRMSAGAPQKR